MSYWGHIGLPLLRPTQICAGLKGWWCGYLQGFSAPGISLKVLFSCFKWFLSLLVLLFISVSPHFPSVPILSLASWIFSNSFAALMTHISWFGLGLLPVHPLGCWVSLPSHLPSRKSIVCSFNFFLLRTDSTHCKILSWLCHISHYAS